MPGACPGARALVENWFSSYMIDECTVRFAARNMQVPEIYADGGPSYGVHAVLGRGGVAVLGIAFDLSIVWYPLSWL
jgi:hypothetical protein